MFLPESEQTATRVEQCYDGQCDKAQQAPKQQLPSPCSLGMMVVGTEVALLGIRTSQSLSGCHAELTIDLASPKQIATSSVHAAKLVVNVVAYRSDLTSTSIAMEFRKVQLGSSRAPFASPYAPLELSEKEKKQLRQLAKELVEVNIDSYEEFLTIHDGKLPQHEWKFFRRDEQVETFVRRRDKYNLQGFGTAHNLHADSVTRTATSLSRTHSEDFASLNVADIRSVGSRDGIIEEALHGAMCPTTETMRCNSEYIQDGVAGCSVLAIIENMTPKDPFTSLSVRWGVTENSPIVRSIVKSYDHVYLDATGFTRLSNGERVAYHLVHSVDFKDATPALSQYFRGQVASIGFWRQKEPNVVEIHGHRVFALPKNATPPKMYNANVSCAVLLSFVKNNCTKGIEGLCKQKNIQLGIELDALNRMLQARLPGTGRPGTPSSRAASSRPVTPTIHAAGNAPVDEEITEALAKKAATESQLEVVAAASKLAKGTLVS
ncbi:hypothetical protein BBJ29_006902 [Phytophthora kernoviae]|uniref:START domain-containing protein n=1 Tax=Phytophthora kernoviae TaxID=325452 RepID=A0A3F2RY75_9STRA|nr:hypothetical protein BBJ29_006902 [Phytophthora kernoviae]RLN65666.1 hypothetical protein BBP00_00002718 [Phytophthora kernoviae]